MAASDKDTIYIDIDDEITGIIDKLRGSKGKVVALVLPKRATVFQSIVNMKLLKRAADTSKKNAVLITSEAGLLPLAGVAGIHVAKTLNSKPEIPLAPEAFNDVEEAIGEDGQEVETPPDPKQTVGALADQSGTKPPADGVETLMLDADDVPPEAEDDLKKAGAKTFEPPKDKKSKNKKLKVPNFNRFRLWLILGGIIILLLLIGFIFASVALPKATITVQTDATNVNANLNLNLSTSATSLNVANTTLPAKLVQQQKSYTASEVTTGQKNEGNQASGSLALTAQICGTIPSNGGPASVPAGNGVSSSGLTFITQQNTSFSQTPSGPAQNHCFTYDATSSTPIQAQTGGASYNGADNFTVAGRSDITAQVSQAIGGGTDNIVQTVNQNDITNAKAKVNTNDTTVEQALENQLQQTGYFAIAATYSPGTPTVTPSANVGAVANSVTITETVTYTMFGVHKSDLTTLVDNNIDSQINTAKQSILDNGINNAVFNVANATATSAQLTMSTKAVAGPQIDVASIKQQSEGQKSGQIQSQLQTDPNVKNVTVKLSPFWITTVPKNPSRITVNIAKPTTTVRANANANNP